MNVVFMGTPDFAVNALEAIIEAGHKVAAVVTQPDKAQGRSGALKMPPVKEKALLHGIKVYQPVKLRGSEVICELEKIKPDVIAVVAFGQLLPKAVLDIPKYGCVNVHASLLPKYRGAAPIQWAVINGDKESGVVTQLMEEGLDTGAILLRERYTLAPDETGGSLFDRLADMGAGLLVKTLAGLEAGTLTPTPQGEGASYASKLEKSMGYIDFTQNAAKIECLIRGLNPWPCAYTYLDGKMLKIWSAAVDKEYLGGDAPGTVYATDKKSIYVAAGEGGIIIKELQLEGKKRMDTESFLRGGRISPGAVLG
ncbi:MAG: methionyl-tRNA formyltransferase [Butyrivibrio sp.]|nr:methionyl-tRNA formyltransferase [Butyrivibrio sp.]